MPQVCHEIISSGKLDSFRQQGRSEKPQNPQKAASAGAHEAAEILSGNHTGTDDQARLATLGSSDKLKPTEDNTGAVPPASIPCNENDDAETIRVCTQIQGNGPYANVTVYAADDSMNAINAEHYMNQGSDINGNLETGVRLAQRLLELPGCAQLFGKDASKALGEAYAQNKIQAVKSIPTQTIGRIKIPGRAFEKGELGVTRTPLLQGKPVVNATKIFLNSNEAFFGDGVYFDQYSEEIPVVTLMNPQEELVMVILHEFAHFRGETFGAVVKKWNDKTDTHQAIFRTLINQYCIHPVDKMTYRKS